MQQDLIDYPAKKKERMMRWMGKQHQEENSTHHDDSSPQDDSSPEEDPQESNRVQRRKPNGVSEV